MRMVFRSDEVMDILKRHMRDNLGISESAISETVTHTTRINRTTNAWVLDEISITVFTTGGAPNQAAPNQGPYRTADKT